MLALGADATAPTSQIAAVSALADDIDSKFWIVGGLTAAILGTLGGLAAGSRGRRVRGAIVGAAAGAVGATTALLLVRAKGRMQVGSQQSGAPSTLYWP